jgi:hypothetical protein
MRKTALCAAIFLVLLAPAVLLAQQEDIDELRIGVETATQGSRSCVAGVLSDFPIFFSRTPWKFSVFRQYGGGRWVEDERSQR